MIALAERVALAQDRLEPPEVEDFEIVGVGGTRVAYLGPDGLVYKVNCDIDFASQQKAEYDNWLRVSQMSLPHDFAVPDMARIDTANGIVIVMEYIRGIEAPWCFAGDCRCHLPVCANRLCNDLMDATGLSDILACNVIIDEFDGMWYIVDFGINRA